jgi:MFS family permease
MASASLEPRPSVAREIYPFGFTSFFNDTATEMAYWVLPAFLTSLGAGPAQLGLIEGIAESAASFAKLLSGYITDRISRRKPLLVAGYAVANVVKPILGLTTAWWQILLIRFTDRVAKGLRGAPRDVMVAETVGNENLGSAYGLIQALDSAGAIAGPLAALFLLAHYSIRIIFWAAAVPGALAILVAVFGIHEKGRTPRTWSETKQAIRPQKSVGLPVSFYLVVAAVTLFSLGNSSDMFLVMRAQSVGISVALAPLLGLVFNITFTLGSWPAGWLSDHYSRHWIAAIGFFIFSAVYFVFGRAPSALAIWIMMAIYGLYYALSQPVLKALVVETVTQGVRGRALGIYFFVTSVTTLLASLITGGLWKRFGPSVPFYLSASLAFASAILLLANFCIPTQSELSIRNHSCRK